MAKEVLKNVLEWWAQNSIILNVKDDTKNRKGLIYFAAEKDYVSVVDI